MKLLKTQKTRRLEAERRALVIKKRVDIFKTIVQECRHIHHPKIIPPLADIYELMDGVSDIIQAASNIAIPDMFADMKEKLPHFAEHWYDIKSHELLALLPPTPSRRRGTLPRQSDPLSRLRLATTSFVCETCYENLTYPRILAHVCMSRCRSSGGILKDSELEHHILLKSRPWTFGLNYLTFDEQACKIGSLIIQECGLDPDTALMSDMDNVWVECTHSECRKTFNAEPPRMVAMPYSITV